jgi:hypothetical protein
MMRRGATTTPGAGSAYRRSFMTTKDELHTLVDQLDEDAAREALARLQE